MNYNDMFNMLGDRPNPFEDQMPMTPQQREFYQTPYQPTFQEQPRPLNWEEAFNGFKTHPVLYNMDGWISPYSSQNWGGTSNILQYIDDQQRIPNAENKIDPNRIFSAEVNGLRALSADQAKILKMFERKFAESLTEKGKVGLTEEDIEAMAAITSARSALASIEREKVNIKKNIADIKIKQSQNNGSSTSSSDASGSRGIGTMDIGRSILDNIFSTPTAPTTPIEMQQSIPTTAVEYNLTNADSASKVIDDLIPTVGESVKFESEKPKTYVVVGETDDDYEFVTYNDEGNIIPDYPNPDTTITSIDRNAKKAYDNLLGSYDIIEK